MLVVVAWRKRTAPVGGTSIRPDSELSLAMPVGWGILTNVVPSNSNRVVGGRLFRGLLAISTLPSGRIDAGASYILLGVPCLPYGMSGPGCQVPAVVS